VAGEYVLRPAGELDFMRAQRLRPQWLAALAEHEPHTLLVDLSEVTFLDSGGLGLLVAAYNDLKQRDAALVLTNLSPRIRKVLALSGLDQVFAIRDDRPQAS
jgi:anti-anti-sigma factor